MQISPPLAQAAPSLPLLIRILFARLTPASLVEVAWTAHCKHHTRPVSQPVTCQKGSFVVNIMLAHLCDGRSGPHTMIAAIVGLSTVSCQAIIFCSMSSLYYLDGIVLKFITTAVHGGRPLVLEQTRNL